MNRNANSKRTLHSIHTSVMLLVGVVVSMAICAVAGIYFMNHHTTQLTSRANDYHLCTLYAIGRFNQEMNRLQQVAATTSVHVDAQLADPRAASLERLIDEMLQSLEVASKSLQEVERIQHKHDDPYFAKTVARFRQQYDRLSRLTVASGDEAQVRDIVGQIHYVGTVAEQLRRLHAIKYESLAGNLATIKHKGFQRSFSFMLFLLPCGGGMIYRIVGFINQTVRDQKLYLRQLQESRDQLDRRVQERTEDLLAANQNLQTEATQRSHAEEQLRIAHAELSQRVSDLSETNQRLESEVAERLRAELKLTTAADQLRRSNHELEEREADLIQAKKTADVANEAKSEFLANMSHELRTPLHGILSFSRFGIDESLTAEREETLDYFQTISQSGDNLLTLVNDLLDLAKLESGKMAFDFQPCDLAGLIAAVADEFTSLTAERNIRILFEPTVGETVVALDQEKIGRVVRNLLSNSVKFSPDGGTVHVSIGETERGPRVTVRDNGPGIPADELELVFDKFAQSSKTKTGAGGTGLGLAICREIMDGHHGRIWAENAPEGGAILSLEISADLQPETATEDDFVDTGSMS